MHPYMNSVFPVLTIHTALLNLHSYGSLHLYSIAKLYTLASVHTTLLNLYSYFIQHLYNIDKLLSVLLVLQHCKTFFLFFFFVLVRIFVVLLNFYTHKWIDCMLPKADVMLINKNWMNKPVRFHLDSTYPEQNSFYKGMECLISWRASSCV